MQAEVFHSVNRVMPILHYRIHEPPRRTTAKKQLRLSRLLRCDCIGILNHLFFWPELSSFFAKEK